MRISPEGPGGKKEKRTAMDSSDVARGSGASNLKMRSIQVADVYPCVKKTVPPMLPVEVVEYIFSRLENTVDVMAAACVCRSWKCVVWKLVGTCAYELMGSSFLRS